MKTLLSFCILIFLLACETTEENTTTSYESLVSEAWTAFLAHDYTSAIAKFDEAISLDNSKKTAYAGKAWTYLFLNKNDSVISTIQRARTIQVDTVEFHVLLAYKHNFSEEFESSNAESDSVLIDNPNWSFSVIPSINFEDLRILKAQNYFYLNDFESSIDELLIINPSLNSEMSPEELADYLESLNPSQIFQE